MTAIDMIHSTTVVTEDLKVAARVGTRKKRVESREKLFLLEPAGMGVAAGT